MMLLNKKSGLLFAVILTGIFLCSCNSVPAWLPETYASSPEIKELSDTLISENENYTLELNQKNMGIILTEKQTGIQYASSPVEGGEEELDELGMPVKRHPQLESTIIINYLDVASNTSMRSISYTSAVNSGKISSYKTKNGVRIEYYFDEAKIMIPVDFTLLNDGVSLCVDPAEIQEDENMLISLSLAPFWCSQKNISDNAYLFYPSGSGALIYPKEISSPGTSVNDAVYGKDASQELWDSLTNEMPVRLPAFGAKNGSAATLAVITSGDDSALINATIGSTSIGYSAVYASFQLRGYTDNIKELYSNRFYHNFVYSESMIKTQLTVNYYPLSGENASYSGMARKYRSLFNLEQTENSAYSTLDFSFVGGAMVPKSFLGIPFQSLFAATTVSQAAEILEDLKSEGAEASNAALLGYGSTGIDSGELAGGFQINKKLGGKQALSKLSSLCENIGASLYFDFDLIHLSKSSNGYNSFFDAAKRANRKQALVYDFDIAVRGRLESSGASLLNRSKLPGTSEKLIKKISSWDISGVGVSSLSSISYSDYSDKKNVEYYSKSGMSADVTQMLTALKVKKYNLMVSGANAYAAAAANAVFNSPTISSGTDIFDEEIPFYQMVFRGSTAISSESINLASNSRKQLLKSVESGSGLAYTLIYRFDKVLIDSAKPVFYNSVYKDLKAGILEYASETAEYYKAISNSSILEHKIHDSGLRETIFSNGVSVFVNYSSQRIDSPAGEIPPESYTVKERRP